MYHTHAPLVDKPTSSLKKKSGMPSGRSPLRAASRAGPHKAKKL